MVRLFLPIWIVCRFRPVGLDDQRRPTRFRYFQLQRAQTLSSNETYGIFDSSLDTSRGTSLDTDLSSLAQAFKLVKPGISGVSGPFRHSWHGHRVAGRKTSLDVSDRPNPRDDP